MGLYIRTCQGALINAEMIISIHTPKDGVCVVELRPNGEATITEETARSFLASQKVYGKE